MSARNIFRVIPRNGRWNVVKDDRLLSTHEVKELAIKRAHELAGNKLSSQVLVYRMDGSVHKPFMN